MNVQKRSIAAVLLLTASLMMVSCGIRDNSQYAAKENWAYLPEEITKEADCFLICPTVYGGDGEQYNMAMEDSDTKEKFVGALNMERGIYENSCNMYAPFYEQASLSVYKMSETDREQYLALAYEDVKESFHYYMENYNQGRPLVLAGFSQGANMVLRLLEEYYDDSDYQNQLVAAYVIGNAVTEADLKNYPHLKMAEAASDTGCIITFNSEAPETDDSILVPEQTLGINPLNWMTDSTEADAALNKGACFTDYSGNIKEEIPALCGAYLDEKRGTLKVTGVTPEEYPPVLDIFESGIYHLYDYQFFYRNLQENVAVRLKQFQTLQFLEKNYKTAGLSVTYTSDTVSENQEDSYVSHVVNVTPEMMEADYWLSKIEDPDEVIMTQEEIKQFNGERTLGYFKYASGDFSGMVSGDELRATLEELHQPGYDCYRNGELLDQEYWEPLLELKNMDAIEAENPIRYGISLSRTGIRVLPTDDVVADAPEFTFFDELQNSSILVNEPVIVMHTSTDGKWYYVLTRYCGGWMHAEDVALCKSQKEWKEAQPEDDFLLVTGDKIRLEYDPQNERTSELELSMSVKLILCAPEEFPASKEGRHAVDNYVVKIPARDSEGYLYYEYAYVQRSQDVHVGYLPYTRTNLLELAFKSHGDRYGWGGMYNARDCSAYMLEVYRCFGIQLGRNSRAQAETNCKTLNLAGMSDETKSEMLRHTPAGSILFFPGHIMMYLGEENERFYVISATGSMVPEDSATGEVIPYQTVMVNDLSATRKNGKTWLQSMEKCKIIWETD